MTVTISYLTDMYDKPSTFEVSASENVRIQRGESGDIEAVWNGEIAPFIYTGQQQHEPSGLIVTVTYIVYVFIQ